MRTDQSIINRYTVTVGVLSYSVTFPLFEQGDVLVLLSTDGGATEHELSLGDDYSVTINGSQTGGTVTLKNGVAQAGNIIAFASNVPYTQELDLSNVSTLDVGAVESQLDRTTQQIQQVAEKATRHLTVPATSSKTPQQVMTEIFDTVSRANEYAQMATDAYEAAVELKETVEQQVSQVGDEQIARVEQTGETEVQDVQAAGQVQIDRLAGYADVGALAEGLAAACQVWKLAEDVPAGATVTLPNELKYIPGHHHLWLSYGGMVISPTFFEEVGDGTETSSAFITKIPFRAGQELMAWVIHLGRVYEVELTDRVNALEEAFAELSRRVVYADEPNNATEATA